MRRYFKEYNDKSSTFFIAADILAVHSYHYERAMRNYEMLEDYRNALYHLDRYVAAYLSYCGEMDQITRGKLDRLRRYYRSEALLQREKGYRGGEQRLGPALLMRGPIEHCPGFGRFASHDRLSWR